MIWNKSLSHYLNPADDIHGNISNLFDLFYQGASKDTGNYPPVNIWSNEENVILIAELPGCSSGAIDVSCKGNLIKISMNSEESSENSEQGGRSFKRTFEAPYKIDEDKTEAIYKDGLLQIIMPRAEQDKPRKITIKG